MPKSLQAHCLKCKSLCSYNRESTKALFTHIKQEHPELPITGISLQTALSEREPSFQIHRGKIKKICKMDCPACGKSCIPSVKKIKKEKNPAKQISTSFMGSFLMLGCWPLCFLPFSDHIIKGVSMECPFCSYNFPSLYTSKLEQCDID